MGMENILKQVVKEHDGSISETPAWHKQLLTKAARIGIISQKTSEDALEFLAFRHLFIHGYGSMLEEEPIRKMGRISLSYGRIL